MDIRIVYTHIYTFTTTGDPVTSPLVLNAIKNFSFTVFKNQIGGNMGVMISVNVLVLKYAETTEPNRK